jgi:hypothetical protein
VDIPAASEGTTFSIENMQGVVQQLDPNRKIIITRRFSDWQTSCYSQMSVEFEEIDSENDDESNTVSSRMTVQNTHILLDNKLDIPAIDLKLLWKRVNAFVVEDTTQHIYFQMPIKKVKFTDHIGDSILLLQIRDLSFAVFYLCHQSK